MFLERLISRKKDLSRVLFKEQVYKPKDLALMVRELVALANLNEKGDRYIVFNASRDMNGELLFKPAERGTANDLKGLVEKAQRYIEPALKVKPVFGDINGKLGAALEITDANEVPYMVRGDAAENLLPGSCWVKDGDTDTVRRAGRADLDKMYGALRKAARPAPNGNQPVRIGLCGDPSVDYLKVDLPDMSLPPSAQEAARIKKTIALRKAHGKGQDTGLMRLMHARENLPYDERGINTLVQGYNSVVSEFMAEDNYYHFEVKAVQLNVTIMNQMASPLQNPSLVLTIPNLEECRVSDRLYMSPTGHLTPKESEIQGYPKVKFFNDTIRILAQRTEVKAEESIDMFEAPLRLSVRPELKGKKIAMHYTLSADNLDEPVTGRLRLGFKK